MTDDKSPQDPEPAQDPVDWKVWPPSPRMQIILIAAAFGLFNLMLLVIWAIVMMTHGS
jgi:hypothetical protein